MTTETHHATHAAVGSPALSEGLGPLLAEADMDALGAVAEQAGLKGVDLHALARVLDAAQRVAVAAERERCAQVCEQEICTCCWDEDALAAADHLAAEIRKGPLAAEARKHEHDDRD